VFTTNRQWPVRGISPFAIQRLDWTGKVPFEVQEIKITPEGFALHFTKPVDPQIAARPATYELKTYTHNFSAGYGSPEVDHTSPVVTQAKVSADGRLVNLVIKGMKESHIHDFDLSALRGTDGLPLLHKKAYYTVNEIPVGAADNP
jgi:hypothetical protein